MGFIVSYPLNGGTATSRALLVDLSDTTNYKHKGTSFLTLERVYLSYDLVTGGAWDIKIGEVLNNGSAVGTVQYIVWEGIQQVGKHFRQYEFAAGGKSGAGLPLALASNAPVAYVSGSIDTAATWAGTANAYNTSYAGTAGRCGAGDLVAEFLEATDGGVLDASIIVEYEAQ